MLTEDRRAVLKDATLSSDRCLKLFPTCLSSTYFDLLSWTKDTWNQRMDGQTTVTHYPTSFEHNLFNTVLKLLAVFSPCFTLFLFPPRALCTISGAGAVTCFCCQALKHTGCWVHPVTLYIVTRPREHIGGRTTSEKEGEKGGTKPPHSGRVLSHRFVRKYMESLNPRMLYKVDF